MIRWFKSLATAPCTLAFASRWSFTHASLRGCPPPDLGVALCIAPEPGCVHRTSSSGHVASAAPWTRTTRARSRVDGDGRTTEHGSLHMHAYCIPSRLEGQDGSVAVPPPRVSELAYSPLSFVAPNVATHPAKSPVPSGSLQYETTASSSPQSAVSTSVPSLL